MAHTNRLAAETSPYLLQHAHNPVDWYPWGAEALERARDLDKPIFLSIGYAACHWCHVMERESFENEDTARLLNEGFVSIKVDREERPDLDAIYMDAVTQMTGHGGWPMSVFLTPDGRPFYGGTYFPDAPRHGMPSFSQVLEGVRQAWSERRDEVEQAGTGLARQIASELAASAVVASAVGAGGVAGGEAGPTDATLDASMLALERSFDASNGGWGGAPKFPQPMTIEFLLRLHLHTGDARPLAMARRSLDAMAAGGIYDQLGGGFARYATDERWLVPHFEKMLYDNAQLARVYVHAWQLTGDATYRAVAEETLSFVERELLTADGGFAASLDADTDGEEGATYVWSAAEIEAALGSDAALFMRAYGVSPRGNWEGHNILSRVAPALSADEEDALGAARAKLLEVRSRRAQPGRDDKVLTAWNGLHIAALADAAAAFDEPRWAEQAARAAKLLLESARDGEGRLFRSWKDGRARHSAVLEDYANLADGLLALYQATFDERWFLAARGLSDTALAHFADLTNGGFFDTADDHEKLIARPKGLQDNAVPSGGAMLTTVLQRLYALTGESRYGEAARHAVAPLAPYVQRYPTAFAQWLNAMTFELSDPIEIAISGDPRAADTRAMLGVVRGAYRPFAVVAAGLSEGIGVPLLDDRPQRDGHATAYVCRQFACRAPVVDPADLASQISIRGMTSRFIVTVFVALTALAILAPATLGHAELESTDPADGASISTPYTVSGTFTEPLVGNSGVVIRNSGGEEVARSSISESDDPTILEVDLPELPAGDYVVRWTATTEDGHTERFTTEFTVVAAATPSSSPVPTEAPATAAPQTEQPSSVPTSAPATIAPATTAPSATPEPAEPTTPSSNNDLLIALLIAGIAVAGVLGYLFLRNRR